MSTLTTIVRQYEKVNANPPVAGCSSSNLFCGDDDRVWATSACINADGALEPDKTQLNCTAIKPDICRLTDQITDPNPQWYSQSLVTQPIVECEFNVDDFVLCKDDNGRTACTRSTSNMFLDTGASYEAIHEYIRKFGVGEFGDQNMNELFNNVLSKACFVPSDECRPDITTGSQMSKCSTINSSSDMGALCYDWYKSTYSPAMERRVNLYCEEYGKFGTQAIWPGDTDWDKVSQDCMCALRLENPTYQTMRQTSTVVYPDACWFTPCIPDSIQLKPDITMFDPTCPTTVCQNIVTFIDNDGNVNNDPNVNIDQYVNCAPGGTKTEIEAELSSESFKNTVVVMFVIILVAFFLLLIAIGVLTFT